MLQIFAACPAPGAAAMDDLLAHGFEHGLRPREGLVRAAAHEGERARGRPADPARHRRVEGRDARRAACIVRALGAFDVDGRAVDDERAARHGGQEIGVSRENMLSGGQHGDDDIRARDRLARIGRDRHAGAGGGRLRRLDEVETCNRMPRLDEIGGHRPAHVAEAEKRDLGHCFP